MKILVPLDGSELALTALTVAEELARAQRVELVLLTVGEVAESSAHAASAREAMARQLDEAATRLQDIPVRTRVELADDAASAIERVADDGARRIVMTTHGRSGLSPLAHGRVADAVLRRVRTPVTLVRPLGEAGKRPEIYEIDPAATAPAAQAHPARALPVHIRLSLLGPFELSDRGESVVLSRGSQRLLAFVALQGRSVSRGAVAEALWPGVPEEHSHASLRSAIWRLEHLARDAMRVDVVELDLSPEVDLDLRDAREVARRILQADMPPADEEMTPAVIAMLSSDLLPDWCDDWAIIRAEDWRQLRLRALEALAQNLLDAGRCSDSFEAASEARAVDPLRESAQALIIRVHLAEGNQSEAVKVFLTYRELLQKELGIEPTQQLRDFMRGLMGS